MGEGRARSRHPCGLSRPRRREPGTRTSEGIWRAGISCFPSPFTAIFVDNSVRDSELLAELRAITRSDSRALMQIPPEQGQFIALLVQVIGARRCIELGTFTGYSSLVVALALPHDGRMVCCDVSAEWTAIARQFWKRTGVAHKIDLRLAPALETLDVLIAAGEAGTYDFAFIDADKENYLNYYERCLRLLRAGGLIAVDNTLWSGRVADAGDQSERTGYLREFNAKLKHDERVTISMVPMGDGLTLALKR